MIDRFFAPLALLAAALCCFSEFAHGQDAQAGRNAPLAKTIGVVTPTGPVPSLFVVNATGAKLEGGILILTGVTPNTIVFADRPVRAAGHVTTEQFIQQWDEGSDNFIKDPPNATVSLLGGDGSSVEDAVITLTSPKLVNGDLTFNVSVLEGSLGATNGPSALFIDRGGGRDGGDGFDGGGFGDGGGYGDRSNVAGYEASYGYGYGQGMDRNYWQAPVLHGAWYAGADSYDNGTYRDDFSSAPMCSGMPGQVENVNCRMPE